MIVRRNLPMWPSGKSTRAPHAVQRDALSGRVQTTARVCLPTKKTFEIIPMYIMNREIIPGRKKGFDGVLYKL